MTKQQAVNKAKEAAISGQCPYVVAHDPKEGQFVFGALKAINLIHPNVRASNYSVLILEDGRSYEL